MVSMGAASRSVDVQQISCLCRHSDNAIFSNLAHQTVLPFGELVDSGPKARCARAEKSDAVRVLLLAVQGLSLTNTLLEAKLAYFARDLFED